MTINIKKKANELVIELDGRLDTITSPELEAVIKNELDGVTALKLDFSKLEYISSAGLRVLLSAKKKMDQQGTMEVSNLSELVREVFDVTGFSDIISIC